MHNSTQNKVALSVSEIHSDLLPVLVILDLLAFFLLLTANMYVVSGYENGGCLSRQNAALRKQMGLERHTGIG